MKKTLFIIGLSLIITTGLSGCFGPFKKVAKDDQTASQTEDAKTSSKDEQKSEKKTKKDKKDDKDGSYFETLTDLMERGKSMKCTYTQEVEGAGTASGVVYMADKNARVEITIDKGKMYSIIDQKWTYSWTEGSSKGYKMTLEAAEMSEKNKETVSDLSKEIDFKCKKWRKDNSKFKVPSNIEFEDMDKMMEGLGDIDLEQTIKDAKAESKKFLCEHCKKAPTPELMAECLGDVVCD